MHSEVVEKVVPFSEELPAVGVVAGEDACYAARSWVRKFYVGEALGVWDVHFPLENF